MHQLRHFLSLIILLVAGLATGCGAALAQSPLCPKISLSTETLQSWYNPKPAADDFLIPIPGALAVVFTPVPLGGEGLYLGEQTVYNMGASDPDKYAFETQLANARVGSAITDRNQSRLLIGKYEFSKGQYVMIMGNGDVLRGMQEFVERWKDDTPERRSMIDQFVREGDPCFKVMTKDLAALLSEPLNFLSYGDYVSVIDRLNQYCIERPNCQKILSTLGENPDLPGFFRLPTEHEWEFVARGGRDFIARKLSRQQLQGDVPFIANGKTLSTYAHIDSKPAYLTPIGSREPWFGFYDMIGNVEELMQNPFTAENGYGAVGAYVARGGHFRLNPDEVRVSKRVELSVFMRDEASPTRGFKTQYFPNAGMRLALGLPIAGVLDRLGDSFDDIQKDYVRTDQAGDIAGNTIAEANVMGAVGSKELIVADEVNRDDTIDYYTFEVREYANVTLAMEVERPLGLLVSTETEDTVYETRVAQSTPAGKPFATKPLLPGKYTIKITGLDQNDRDNKYRLTLNRTMLADTGIERADTASLTKAQSIAGGRGTQVDGYVGGGDRADFYPIKLDANTGGISVIVTGNTATVNVTVLDDRQRAIAQATGVTGKPIELLAPMKTGQRGFVQITSEGSGSTLYKMAIASRSLYDPIFVTRTTDARSWAKPKTTYGGYVSNATPRLIMPLLLSQNQRLRAELSGLDADVDLEILGANGARISTTTSRKGTSPEFLELDLEVGKYFLQATLKDSGANTKFDLYFDIMAYAGSAKTDPAAARNAAKPLTLMATGDFRNGSSKGELQYYTFTATASRTSVIIDVTDFDAAADLDIFLENSSGGVIGKSQNSGRAAEAITAELTAGKYYLRVQPAGTAKDIYYSLSLVGQTAMLEPNLSGFGSLMESFEDWDVYRTGDYCYMITRADSTAPDLGWLRERPYFYIGVERGSSSIWASLLTVDSPEGKDQFRSKPTAKVVHSNGTRQTVAAMFDPGSTSLGPWIPRGDTCESDRCLSTDSVVGFRRGRSLEITGTTTATGVEAKITYSLEGYTKSAKRINELCGADAYWIVNN